MSKYEIKVPAVSFNVSMDSISLDNDLASYLLKRQFEYFNLHFKGTVVDLGCGKMMYKETIIRNQNVQNYIGVDIYNPKYQSDIQPDLIWNGTELPIDSLSVDCILSTSVFEHLPNIESVLKEIFRVLKNEGILLFAVPFLWPLHDVPNDEYRYTPFALRRLFLSAGFAKADIKATGGWDMSLAMMLSLWISRSQSASSNKKHYISMFTSFIEALVNNDSIPEVFEESMMLPGIYGVVTK